MMSGTEKRGRSREFQRFMDAAGEVLDLLEKGSQRGASKPRRDARQDDRRLEAQRARVAERPGAGPSVRGACPSASASLLREPNRIRGPVLA
jgi:hypothetical protein